MVPKPTFSVTMHKFCIYTAVYEPDEAIFLPKQSTGLLHGWKVTGQLFASQWHEKYSHFHLHPKQALFLDFSIVSMGARDLVSNPFPVYYLCTKYQKFHYYNYYLTEGGWLFCIHTKTCCLDQKNVFLIRKFQKMAVFVAFLQTMHKSPPIAGWRFL